MAGNDVTGASVPVFLGIGSNLDEPRHQLDLAFTALSTLENTRLVARSSVYRSPPMGPQDQPDFLNAVVALETRLAAEDLLDRLQAIERAQGRVRERRWGPRTLDIDILLYGDKKISTSRLIVPHPGLPERAFVLYPLAELAPDFEVPGFGKVADLVAGLSAAGVQRLESL